MSHLLRADCTDCRPVRYLYRFTFGFSVFNDGSTKMLLNLHGTIPVKYKGNTYNIPICIWLMDTHPKNAPICYVKPTPEMRIKVSAYVDFNGKIYLPYLHDWNPVGALGSNKSLHTEANRDLDCRTEKCRSAGPDSNHERHIRRSASGVFERTRNNLPAA